MLSVGEIPVMPTLRLAGARDAEPIAALFSASFRLLDFLPELHSVVEDRAFIRDHVLSQQRVTIAERDGGIVGFMSESDGWIHHLYIETSRLRSGIGSLLLNDAKARNGSLELWCFAANHGGRAFYERHGFVVAERTDGAGNEAGAPDIRYRWERSRDP